MFVIYEPSLYDHGLYLLIGNLSEKLYRVTEGMSFVRPIVSIFKAVSVFSAIDIKNSHYFSVNVFSTKVLIRDITVYVSYWKRDRHFAWTSEPREGLAVCRAKAATPSFLSN